MRCLLLATLLFGTTVFAQENAAPIPGARVAPGFRSINIGGLSLRYACQGEGSPTVIVEQGAGISVEATFSYEKQYGWAYIAPRIAQTTRICVYDRAGLGNSSAPPSPRTSVDSAHDLHALLEREKIAPPYVFAGHSAGGINARAFASEYPGTVKGLVLVDASTPDQSAKFAKALPPRSPDESAILQGFRDGPDRSMQGGEWYDFKANAELANSLRPLGNIPLIVVTRSPNWTGPSVLPKAWDQAIEPVWQRMQADLTQLSPNSKQVIAKKSGHNVQAQEPDLVIDAIFDVVKQVRKDEK